MMRLNQQILWILTSLLVVTPSLAHAGWSVPRGPSEEPAKYQYKPDDLKKAPKSFFEDASACLIYYGATYLVDQDGTTSTISHEVTRLNGRRGISNLGEYRGITYYPSYQKLTLNEARVIKPDGRVVSVGPENIKLRDASTDYQTYNLRKELVISFPELQVNDVYEVKWTIRGKSPEFGDEFFNRYNFGSRTYPVLSEQVLVRLPKSKKLKHKLLNTEATLKTSESKYHKVYQWRIDNQPPLPEEDDMPPRGETRPQLMCSTYTSWTAIGRWKHELRKDCWVCTEKIRKIVQDLTKNCKTPEKKAKALTYWVRQNVRYISITSGANRYTTQRPEQVIANRYGDCKDQSQLLAVMLREIGLPVYQVSLGMRGDGQIVEDVPSPWATHAILMVKINGKKHWIDTTSSDAAWDFLPRVDRGRVVTLTDAQGNLTLDRTPELTVEENRFVQKTIVDVLPDGSTESVRIVSYRGHAGLVRRESWLDTPRGQRRRRVAAELRDANSNSKLLALKIREKNVRDLDAPVNASIKFRIPEHFSGTDYLEASFTDSHVWSRFLAYNPGYNREQSLDLWGPFESFHQYEIVLPSAYRFDTRERETTHTSKWGIFRVQVERNAKEPRKLLITFHTRRRLWRVEPSDFKEYRRFRQKVYDNWRVWIGLRPTKLLEDAPALEKHLAKEPKDTISAKILARLYLEKKRSALARRVLDRAKAATPDDKQLWELAARATATWEAEAKVYANMVRRFPGEKQYAVELGRLRVNLNDFKRARQVLDPITESKNDNLKSRAHYHLARLQARRGRYNTALAHLATARAADNTVTNTANVWRLEGQVRLASGETEKAFAAYRKALALKPKAPKLLQTLVDSALQTGRKREAIDFLRQYTLAVRGNLPGLVRAAQYHYRMGRLNDAYDCAMRARDINFHADAQKILGLVHWKRGDHKRAVFHLQRANEDNQALVGLIHCHLALGSYARALEYLTKAERRLDLSVQLTAISAQMKQTKSWASHLLAQQREHVKVPASVREQFSAAVALLGLGQRELAISTLGKVIEQTPRFASAYALRGRAFLDNGNVLAAERDATKALKLRPSMPFHLLVMGRVHFEQNNPKAVSLLEKAATLTQRKEPEVLHWFAAALFADDQVVSAIIAQRDAVALDRKSDKYRNQLEKFERSLEGK